MQMHIYSQWLTVAVNNVEFISLKPWAWHSRGCDPTHKRFAIIVSGNVNPPKGNSPCWCSSTGSASRISTVTVKVIESSSQAHHIDTESNLVSDPRQSLSLSTIFCCELNCLAGGTGAIWGMPVPLSPCLLYWTMRRPLYKPRVRGFPGDPSWSILI